MNILNLAKSRLTSETLLGFSEVIGIESSRAPQLISEAIPTVLAILKESASDASKASLVDQFLASIDVSILEQPAEVIAQNEVWKGSGMNGAWLSCFSVS